MKREGGLIGTVQNGREDGTTKPYADSLDE